MLKFTIEKHGAAKMILLKNGIPRRARIDLHTPAETAIRNAMLAVEEAGADPLLTDAVGFLNLAKDRVADYVDRTLADAGQVTITQDAPTNEDDGGDV